MLVCCCSLAGTAACRTCFNNPYAETPPPVRTYPTTQVTDKVLITTGVQTNADRIRSMTDEELAEMMVYKDCPTIEMSLLNCPEKYCPDGETHDCRQCWLDWLRQEVSDNG